MFATDADLALSYVGRVLPEREAPLKTARRDVGLAAGICALGRNVNAIVVGPHKVPNGFC